MCNKETSIIFTGDIGFDRYMSKRWEDDQLLSKAVLDFCHSADHLCANVEGALINAADNGAKGIFFHSMDPAAISALKKMNSDIWCIANNHTLDAGIDGVISTQDFAREHGVATVGAGINKDEASRPIYVDGAGGIGIIAVGYMDACVPATETSPGVFRWDDMDAIAERIAEIKSKCRWCVIISHGGEEFAAMPLPYTRERYLKYLELGADVVVGHHPHVPENYELFEDQKAIFYSVGNFIFDTDYQRAHKYTDVGVLLKLVFSSDTLAFEAIGTVIDRESERIDVAPLPDIFTNVPGDEYNILAPLSTKAFIEEEKRRMIFLHPEKYANAPCDVWNSYFMNNEAEEYVAGIHMDLALIFPVSEQAEKGTWKQSKLEKVKDYLLTMI